KFKIIKYVLKVLIFLSFLSTSSIYSQNEQQPQQTQEKKEEELKAVPVIEIPQKIEEAYVQLKEIESLKSSEIPVRKKIENFQKLVSENESFKKDSTPEYFKSLPTRKLEDFDNKWNAFLNNITKFKKTLESRAEKLNDAKVRIKRANEVWVLTVKNAKSEKAPKSLLKRLGEFNKDLNSVDKFLVTTLDSILSLRDKVSMEEIAAKEILSTIENEISEKKSLLFTFDSPPIWKALSDSSDTTTIAQRWTSTKKNISNSFSEFYDLYSSQIPFYILFFLLILFIVFLLGLFAKKNIEDDEAGKNKDHSESLKLLSRTFSISLLIALFFEYLFFPLAPRIVAEIFTILFIFPLLRLFPIMITKVSRGPLFYVTFIFLLQRIMELASTNSLNQRFIVNGLIILLISAMYWMLKIPIDKIPEKRRSIVKVLHTIIKVMIGVLVLTLIANIVGNTTLSRLVLNGVMNAIYVSLLLITAFQVFYELLTIFLQTKFANLFLIVRNNRDLVKNTTVRITKLVTYFIWIAAFLDGFALYDPLKNAAVDFFNTSWNVGETTISVGNIILFFFSIWLSIKLSRLTRFILDGEILPRLRLPRGVPGAVSLITGYIIITFGLLFALLAVGFDMTKFSIIAGALGVGIGFGLQNIVNNFISGLILLFERPVQVGDVISIQNLTGTVKRIGIRSSVIKGFDGSEEIVPNADLISSRVTNWTLSDKHKRIEIKIGVEYGTDPDKVIELLKYSISSRDDILKDPEPYVLFDGYGESSLNFTFRFWTANRSEWIFIKSEVLLFINKLLNDAGIVIPFPQMDVHINENTNQKKSDSGKEEEK
ncbi:Potassium efflux system KefA protein / Small-conductance mechanosensitive channel, partial [hydrothermal vent metagenome]